MFKKEHDLTERSNTLLKNKEIKKLKADISSQIKGFRESELDNLFASSKGQVTQIKLSTRTILYCINGRPYFFDLLGRNNLYPSMLALWEYPDCLLSLTVHGPVSSFILRGADLFVPGLSNTAGLELLEKGAKVSIRISDNPLPFAVGEAGMCWEAILMNHGQGKAAICHHYYGDKLLSANFLNPHCLIYSKSSSLVNYTNDKVNDEPIDVEDSNDNSELAHDIEPSTLNLDTDPSALDTEVLIASEQQQVPSSVDLTPDERLLRAFLLTARYIIKDEQLPILASSLWLSVQKCASADSSTSSNTSFDIKKTSYRKVSTFLEHLQSIGLLTTESIAEGVSAVAEIDRDHELFRNAALSKVPDSKAFKLAYKELAANAAPEVANSSSLINQQSVVNSLSSEPGDRSISIVELFKLPKNLRDIFYSNVDLLDDASKLNEYGDSILSYSCVKALLLAFIQKHNLEDASDRAYVILSPECEIYRLASKFIGAEAASVKGKEISAETLITEKGDDKLPLREEFSDDEPIDQPSLFFNDDSGDSSGLRLVAGVMISSNLSETDIKVSKLNISNNSFNYGSSSNNKLMAFKTGVTPLKPVSLPSASAAKSKQKMSSRLHTVSSDLSTLSIANHSDHDLHSTSKKSDKNGAKGIAEGESPIKIRKDDLLKGFISKLTPYHAILLTDGSVKVCYGKLSKVTITQQKRAGNKMTTCIRGLDAFGLDLNNVAKDLKKMYACSVAVSPVPGIPQEKEIVMQGNMVIRDTLVKKYGIPSKAFG